MTCYVDRLLTLEHTACAMYWTFGPTLTYSVCAVAMFALAIGMRAASKRAL